MPRSEERGSHPLPPSRVCASTSRPGAGRKALNPSPRSRLHLDVSVAGARKAFGVTPSSFSVFCPPPAPADTCPPGAKFDFFILFSRKALETPPRRLASPESCGDRHPRLHPSFPSFSRGCETAPSPEPDKKRAAGPVAASQSPGQPPHGRGTPKPRCGNFIYCTSGQGDLIRRLCEDESFLVGPPFFFFFFFAFERSGSILSLLFFPSRKPPTAWGRAMGVIARGSGLVGDPPQAGLAPL